MSAPEHHLRRTVLVIDDEIEIGRLIEAAAEELGLSCTILTSALQMGAELDSGTVAVVVDLMMPDMDGIELVRLLAQRGCSVPVVLMSGHDRSVLRSAEEMARALGLRTAGPLRKPFRIAEVEALLGGLTAAGMEWDRAPAKLAGPLDDDTLRGAIHERAVVMHYQPQVRLATGEVTGVEALVRLQLPHRGLVYPDRFIPAAERLNLIDELTNVVMERSFQEFVRIRQLPVATLSVNVSAASLVDLTLPDRIARCAERAGLSMSRVVVEITESGLIQEFAKALDVLARLRLRGAGVAIDDLGTGYSSMAQLRRVPCTEVKIDRTFVKDMLFDEAAMALVEELINLAGRLNLKLVAEGVETEQQAQALLSAGCEYAQGYFFSRALPRTELAEWVDAYTGATTGRQTRFTLF
jgi:EAL domain-containing protein (putative c-di-GMP-specific phosphodiesterase class I)/ActR/RegA family two-component response regulator